MTVFLSCYYNHHQASFCEALYKELNGEFYFISTTQISSERIALGWKALEAPFLLDFDKNTEKCTDLINNADVVLFGSAPYELLKPRLKAGKLTVFYSERVYKTSCPLWQIPLRAIKYFIRFGRYKNAHLLCASAYSAGDYALTGTFINKTYKWGYFSEVKKYDSPDKFFIEQKTNGVPMILWTGRFLNWKHPELALNLAKRLRDNGYKFNMNIIGTGETENLIKNLIAEYSLEETVTLLGAMKPNEVRLHMEKANIYLFTSDRNEGWGAVLNESMNSGCAVVSCREIGATPFLIDHGKNGYAYNTEDELYQYVAELIQDTNKQRRFGLAAYKTISEAWCPDIAANRFVLFVNELRKYGKCTLFDDGPCSIAPRKI